LKFELDVLKLSIDYAYLCNVLTNPALVVWSPPHHIWIWCTRRAWVALLIAWWVAWR